MPPACVINCDDAHESKIGTDLNLTSPIHGIDSLAMSNDIRIGTQGWNYEAWVGPFYPSGTRPADFLAVYSRAFTTVEVDSTFYAIPAAKTVRGWAERTPPEFSFALKMPQEITHENRLRDSADLAALFFDRARELGPKLVRTSAIEPGIVATELQGHVTFQGAKDWLGGAEKTMEFLQPENVAESVGFIVAQPKHVNLQQVVIMPTKQTT